MNRIYAHFHNGFRRAAAERDGEGRRIGAELKFPLVNDDGTAASLETARAMWQHLVDRGWSAVHDPMSGGLVGAARPGEKNDTLASCETAYCKTEFSLAHVADLWELKAAIGELIAELRPFSQRHGVYLLAYGMQPVSPPGDRLMMKKTRTCVWGKVFGANRCIAPADGDDVCLFTVNAATHVHLSVSREEAIPAVNVLNGFSGAQLALTAHSSVWKGSEDASCKCAAEMLWDQWMPDANRVGVPEKQFADLEDYVRTVASFKPVYVKRDGMPVILRDYPTFAAYYACERAKGYDVDGREVAVVPEPADIDLHSTCYWFNARLSRYYTVENRTNDQQPPDDLLCVPALTLGLISSLAECVEALRSYSWDELRAARPAACRQGLAGAVGGRPLTDFAAGMLALARLGLERRERGEEVLLEPLERRLRDRCCPADEAAELFRSGGIASLIEARKL